MVVVRMGDAGLVGMNMVVRGESGGGRDGGDVEGLRGRWWSGRGSW